MKSKIKYMFISIIAASSFTASASVIQLLVDPDISNNAANSTGLGVNPAWRNEASNDAITANLLSPGGITDGQEFGLATKTAANIATESGDALTGIIEGISFTEFTWDMVAYSDGVDRFGDMTTSFGATYAVTISTATGDYRFASSDTFTDQTGGGDVNALETAHSTAILGNGAWLTTGGLLGDINGAGVTLGDVTGISFTGTADSSGVNNTDISFYVIRSFGVEITTSAIPEPASAMLILLGAVLLIRRKKRP